MKVPVVLQPSSKHKNKRNPIIMPVPVQQSYKLCGQIVRKASTNFFLSFWLLPRAQRRAMSALYAFARFTDDLGDSDEPLLKREEALLEWKAKLAAALEGQCADPILPALADTVKRFQIPHQYLFDVVSGVLMDTHHRGYETIGELENYSYHVASVVGLSCLHIWGFQDEAIRKPAIQCGYAFQLTNILRDLKEDLERERIYLPREDLKRFGYDEEHLRQKLRDKKFDALVQFQIERAEQYYAEAAATANYLRGPGRRMFCTMFNTYRGLLREIERRPHDLFKERIRLPFGKKLGIVFSSCVRGIR